MEPIGTFQGLASGINFRDLVDQIIQAESRPITLLQNRISEIDRKKTAWGDFESRVKTIFDRAKDLSSGSLFNSYLTGITGYSGATAPVSVSAGTSAAPGSFGVAVTQLATREKVGGDVVQDRTAALGLSGEFLVGGRAVALTATDSLDDVAAKINQVNKGATASGVSASVVAAPSGGSRLVLTAASTGAAGIALADGSGGVLQGLGFLDGSTVVRHGTSDGAMSDAFQSSSSTIAAQRGLTSPPAAAAVGIGGLSVTLDLSTMSLDDIATAINTEAGLQGNSISAQVVTASDASGNAVKRLDVSGTTSFTDEGGILQTLGVLEGGRAAVAQQVQGAALTAGDAVTPATGATLLTDLWGGGASSGVQAGDTLTLTGTRGDGSTFSKSFVVGGGSTYQDLVDALNSATDGYKVGSRTATAGIAADGSLVVTDDQGGDSRLALGIVANNEGGGTLDFGAFSTVTAGRAREITAGVDAEFLVDGAFYARSSNTVTDVVAGVTLTLKQASMEEVTVSVDRDVDAVVAGIESFVKAYNAASEFVNSQFTGAGAEEGQLAKPLSGDTIIRQMRSQLRSALEATISSSVTDVRLLSQLGITLNREGTYDIDKAALRGAIEDDAVSVQRYFSEYGTGSTGSLEYVGASDATKSGAYDVVVTTLAQQASVTGAGFAGTYVDDGTPDTLTITDAGTGSTYEVQLANGATLADIISALNSEFQTSTQRILSAPASLKSDVGGTAAGDATRLQDLHDAGGTNLGVANGDTFTISGARSDGSTFFREWVLTDVSTQTLGDLEAELQDLVGSEVEVSVQDGTIVATALEAGAKSFTVAVSSDNAGGGTFSMGSLDVTQAGRSKASITASDVGGQLSLAHGDYGAAMGFDVAYTGGGADGSASLGLAAGSYRGIDVAGTIGGQAATGSGRVLTGAEGSSAEGLILRYTGSSTGSVGKMTYSVGIAALMERAADALLDTGAGTLKGVVEALDTRKQGLDTRIDDFELRLGRREEFLIKRFTALEEAMALAQTQLAWLQSQLGSLPTRTSASSANR